MRISSRPRGHYTMPIGAGRYVRLKRDPRHIGRTRYAYGTFVRVQWEKAPGDPRWISEHDAGELTVITKQEAEQ